MGRRVPVALSIAIAALLAGVAGCSSPAEAPAAPATFSAIYPRLFPVTTKSQCNFCHGLPPNDKSNGSLSMGMDKATAYAALVGKIAVGSACAGKSLVSPNQPGLSLFLQKLGPGDTCGSHMPLGGDPLTSEELDQVARWIAAGAKDD